MKIFQADAEDAPREVARILMAGGVAAVPTETVYGLVCLWRDSTARSRIYALKRRPAEKRLQMLASSVESAVSAGLDDSPRLRRLSGAFWPGPLTVVAPSAACGSIGLRIPASPFVLSLLRELGEPLAATSANLAGSPPGLTAADAVRELDGEPDALVDGGFATVTGGLSSTVVSIMDGEPGILREGQISLEAIRRALASEENG